MIIYHEIDTPSGKVRGYEHKPVLSRGKVFIQHGYFSSNHLGPNRLYLQIAENLFRMNFTVYRFACIGMGDSDGAFTETSYQLHIDNNIAVIQYFQDPESKLILIGHSMGTSVSIRLATFFKVDKIILISPSLGEIDNIENLFTATQLLELETKGETERKGLTIKAEFMRRSQDTSVFDYCKTINSNVQLHYGLMDELYNIHSTKKAVKHLNGKLNFYPNADHNFLDIRSREDLIKELTEYVAKEEISTI